METEKFTIPHHLARRVHTTIVDTIHAHKATTIDAETTETPEKTTAGGNAQDPDRGLGLLCETGGESAVAIDTEIAEIVMNEISSREESHVLGRARARAHHRRGMAHVRGHLGVECGRGISRLKQRRSL